MLFSPWKIKLARDPHALIFVYIWTSTGLISGRGEGEEDWVEGRNKETREGREVREERKERGGKGEGGERGGEGREEREGRKERKQIHTRQLMMGSVRGKEIKLVFLGISFNTLRSMSTSNLPILVLHASTSKISERDSKSVE
jgi:hypothetical protein